MRPFFMVKLFTNTVVLVLAVVGYLQPFHSIPWMSALNSGVFLLLGLILAAVGVIASRTSIVHYGWGELCVWSLVLLHAIGTYTATQKSLWPVVLVLGITYFCVKLPMRKTEVASVLMLAIFVAGCISALFGLGLWLGAAQQYDTYQIWMAHAEPGTPLKSNLGQPNHAGTLLLWALAVAVYYANQVERSRKWFPWYQQAAQGALLACSLLMASAMALTQSRTALLNLVLMMACAMYFRKELGAKAMKLATVGFVVVLLCTAMLPDIKQFLFETGPTGVLGGKGFSDNARVVAYTAFFEAVKSQWLTGYGIGGITHAYLENLNSHRPLGSYFGEAHNLLLEILVTLGIPLGAGVIFLLARFILRACRNIQSVQNGVMLSMVAVVSVHSMLEYPLHYAYFLIPAAIFIRLLQPETEGQVVRVAWYWLGIIWLAFVILFVVVAKNYFQVEQDLRSARVEAAITGKPKPADASYSNLIRELEALNIALRTDTTSRVSPSEMRAFTTVVHVYPTRQLVQNYISILTAAGNTSEASVWSKRLRMLYGDTP